MAKADIPDPVCILIGSSCPISSLKYVRNENAGCDWLFSGNQNGEVSLWDLNRRRVAVGVKATQNEEAVIGIVPRYLHGEMDIITHCRDGTIKTWKCTGSDMQELDTWHVAPSGFCGGKLLTFDDTEILAIPSDTKSCIALNSLDDKSIIGTLRPEKNRGMIMSMCYVEEGMESSGLWIGYEDGTVALWDMRKMKEVTSGTFHQDTVMSFDVSKNLNKGVSVSVNNEIVSFKIKSDLELVENKRIEVTNDGFNSVMIREDDKLFTTCGWDGKVRYFSMKKMNPLAVLDCHKQSVQCQDFGQNKHLAVGSKDGNISIWNLYT